MKIINQLLDYTTPWDLPDIYLFTGNPIIKKNGAIVMGRGAAKEVRDTFPGIDKMFGDMIQQAHTDNGHPPNILLANKGTQYIAWFKVKEHWKLPADPSVIARSVIELTQNATDRPKLNFHMNYPGIGNGRLHIRHVAPLLESLPDNVLLYRAVDSQYSDNKEQL